MTNTNVPFTRSERLGPAGTACRICGGSTRVVLDLGKTPLANAFPSNRDENLPTFPLALEACVCGNLQLGTCVDPEVLYANYLYVTPDSTMLTAHYRTLAGALRERGMLAADSAVLEIGSNVGTFLAFLAPSVASVIGVDPAENICELARAAGVPTVCAFFDLASARAAVAASRAPDVIFARHCMAHNEQPYTMLEAAAEVLAPAGTIVIENAYGVQTIEGGEFDQIYHEHMFYFTVHAVSFMLERVGLRLVDVLPAPIHGGSLVFMARRAAENPSVSEAVGAALAAERISLADDALIGFRDHTQGTVERLRALLAQLAAEGARVYAYGASAKGSTLLNVIGAAATTIAACADSTPIKVGRFVPGVGIPIVSEASALADPPDAFLLTAWNYRNELIAKVRRGGNERTGFVIPIPVVEYVAGHAAPAS